MPNNKENFTKQSQVVEIGSKQKQVKTQNVVPPSFKPQSSGEEKKE